MLAQRKADTFLVTAVSFRRYSAAFSLPLPPTAPAIGRVIPPGLPFLTQVFELLKEFPNLTAVVAITKVRKAKQIRGDEVGWNDIDVGGMYL